MSKAAPAAFAQRTAGLKLGQHDPKCLAVGTFQGKHPSNLGLVGFARLADEFDQRLTVGQAGRRLGDLGGETGRLGGAGLGHNSL